MKQTDSNEAGLKTNARYPGRDFVDKVARSILDHNMLSGHDSVLVGVSGGPDSVALLHALLDCAHRFSIDLGIAHVNHCLRMEDSDNDAAFVEALAKKLGLPFHLATKDVGALQQESGLSMQEAARLVRYRFYRQTAKERGYTKIALGHHGGDNAELVLMYLLRGSGSLGISGIPPAREGLFIRPLIRQSKSDISDYIAARGLDYVTDKSNKSLKYLRNRIREQLIPELESSYNPQVVDTLNRLSMILREEESWMEEITQPVFQQLTISSDPSSLSMSAPGIQKLHTAAKRRIIRSALKKTKGDLRRITFAHVDSIIKLLEKDKKTRQIHLPGRIRAVKKGNVLTFVAEKSPLREIGPP